MGQTRERSNTQAWIADFLVAGVLALIATFFLMDWLADRACVQSGGVVRNAGADAFCDTVDGSRPLSSVVKGSAILYWWMGITAIFLTLARIFINRGPRRKAAP
jgi:hypothetical protein